MSDRSAPLSPATAVLDAAARSADRRALLPNGLADLLPPDAAQEAGLIATLIEAFAARGYERVKPPLVEFEDSLLTGPGAAVATQTFRMMDPVSRHMLGLRADITPQIARIAATRLVKAPRPLRLSYAGQVLQLKGSDLRPERQFTQAGVELVGGPQPASDAEVAVLAMEALTECGVKDPVIDLGVPPLIPLLLAESGETIEAGSPLRQALDRKDRRGVRDTGGPMADRLIALLQASGPVERALAAAAEWTLPAAAAALIDQARVVADALAAALPEVTVTLDFVENRGFEYHTGVSFTILAPGVRGELGRGGRYRTGDGDDDREMATGMTLYLDSLMRATAPAPVRRRVLLPVGTSPAEAAALRADGWVTIAALDPAADARDEARRQSCEAILIDGEPVPLT